MISSNRTGSYAATSTWTRATSHAAVRTLVTPGDVSLPAAMKRRPVAPVRVETCVLDARVVRGAFPGSSAWSPPI